MYVPTPTSVQHAIYIGDMCTQVRLHTGRYVFASYWFVLVCIYMYMSICMYIYIYI